MNSSFTIPTINSVEAVLHNDSLNNSNMSNNLLNHPFISLPTMQSGFTGGAHPRFNSVQNPGFNSSVHRGFTPTNVMQTGFTSAQFDNSSSMWSAFSSAPPERNCTLQSGLTSNLQQQMSSNMTSSLPSSAGIQHQQSITTQLGYNMSNSHLSEKAVEKVITKNILNQGITSMNKISHNPEKQGCDKDVNDNSTGKSTEKNLDMSVDGKQDKKEEVCSS